MERKLILLVLFLVSSFRGAGQVGNEWINFGQVYFKIPIAADGIYRLTYADLQAAGFPVGTADPRKMQLFLRGSEVAIRLIGEADAVFHPVDYLEFFGRRNDGTLDAQLYKPTSAQLHPYYNLYSDTASYFLTVTNQPTPGRRMEEFFELNVTSISPETSYQNEILLPITTDYATGYAISDVVQSTSFDQGEGWVSPSIRENQEQDFVIEGLTSGVPADGSPGLEIKLVGREFLQHRAEVFVGPNSLLLRSLGTVDFADYGYQSFTATLNWSDIGADGRFTFRVRALGVGGQRDNLSVAYGVVSHPRIFAMSSSPTVSFQLWPNAGGKSYIEIASPPAGARVFDVTDPVNPVVIGTTINAGNLAAVVPSTTGERKLLVSGEIGTPAIKRVTFRSITPTQHDYIIISHPRLRTPASGYTDPVKAYAEYRATMAGGGFDTLVVNMDQLFDQFSYGEKSPLSILNFMKFMTSGVAPKFLFLVGKGLDVHNAYYRNSPGSFTYPELVASAGMPGSDMYYTAGLGGTQYEPLVPTGRLTATNAQQVAAYLNKVKEMEALPFDALWRKDVLHLSGGITPFDLQLFRAYMDGFARLAEGPFFGGNVTTIAKQAPSVVEQVNISDQVNAGLNLVTFYGHSAPSVIDIDIGFVSDPLMGYNNAGKYPMFLVNGCNAGAFFSDNYLFGEDWIMTANKGATGFIAHSSFGQAGPLKRYSDNFYAVAYGDSLFIHKGIGEIQKETARLYMSQTSQTLPNISQVQQMVLLGDPAVRLFGAPKPDYDITENDLSVESFDGSPVTAQTDSFRVVLISRNLALAPGDSLQVRLVHTLGDGTSVVFDSLRAPLLYQDTLHFVIRNSGPAVAGNNNFRITLNYGNTIPETNFTNNTAGLDVFIPLNGTLNLFPANFGIVSTPVVELVFQSTRLNDAARSFSLELDTTDGFDSPFLKTFIVSGQVLVKQSVALLSSDSTTYYWRTRFASPQPNESDEWQTTSFSYIAGSPGGWAQIHFPQFLENSYSALVPNASQRRIEFVENQSDVFIRTFGSTHPSPPTDVSVKIDGTEYIIGNQQPCRDNTLNLIAFNKTSLTPYAPIVFSFQDPRSCGRTPQLITSFLPSELETGLGNDLPVVIDLMAPSDSVVLFSIGDADYASWSGGLIAKLGEVGISPAQVAGLLPGEPVVIWGRKGSPPGTATVIRTSNTPANEQEIQHGENITGRPSQGTMVSATIGPVLQWNDLFTQVTDKDPDDSYSFNITGYGLTGTGTDLLSVPGSTPLSIDAALYPHIRIAFEVSDPVNLTPAQLRKWIVTHEPAPEGLLIEDSPPNAAVYQEGESFDLSYGFVNLSATPFQDSLVVEYEVHNQPTGLRDLMTTKILAPQPSDTTFFTLTIWTTGKVGVNDFRINVNPRIEPEMYFDNNRIDYPALFEVKGDKTNPVIDLVIDGRHILDGEIVSSSPQIVFQIKDENKLLLKTDTAGVNFFLKYPADSDFRRIAFSRSDVSWTAATSSANFNVQFAPAGLPDGTYTLKIEGSDASGNTAGTEPFTVRFEIVSESTISNFYPYPNPFSTSTRFIFTLTGDEIPDQIKIQILTVSGRVVREISEDEIGQIHIGNNLTEFAWDGRDEFGDQLANGVYLYRVIARIGGEPVKLRGTAGDRGFEKGYGKLYLLR